MRKVKIAGATVFLGLEGYEAIRLLGCLIIL
jgi:hypothetical protein